MKKKLDLNQWNRKEHFEFFNSFDEPYFGLVANIDCKTAYKKSKEIEASLFLYYLHKALIAANRIENFKYKIIENEVFIYDQIDATPTIAREDGTFGFSYLKYFEAFKTFIEEAQKVIEIIKKSKGLFPPPELEVYENVVEFSSIPWIDFTSLSHARSFSYKNSSPKISFGKLSEKEGKLMMPVSLHVHHGLMDGFHTGLFYQYFQEELDS